MSEGRREMNWELKSYKSAEEHKKGLGTHRDGSREVLRAPDRPEKVSGHSVNSGEYTRPPEHPGALVGPSRGSAALQSAPWHVQGNLSTLYTFSVGKGLNRGILDGAED